MHFIGAACFIRIKPLVLATIIGSLLLGSCGERSLTPIVVEGTVTCGNEKVEMGRISFHPLEGTSGPTCAAAICDGHYCVDVRGGVLPGRYRVEIVAEKRTGRRVMRQTLPEPHLVDETVPMGLAIYTGPQSPLVVEIKESGDSPLDFDLPRK